MAREKRRFLQSSHAVNHERRQYVKFGKEDSGGAFFDTMHDGVILVFKRSMMVVPSKIN